MNDDIMFAPEEADMPSGRATACEAAEYGPVWKVLIVDDEEEVHVVTRLVLSDIIFEDRKIVCLSAHSAQQGYEMLAATPDIAVVLLDVVMETNQAGLELVQRIREDLNNPFVRIVLRTGQPGQAPEREVITRYDINDYKHKTELTAQRLFTTVIAALRAYRGLRTIDRSKRGLEYIIGISREIFRMQSLPDFAGNMLGQMTDLVLEDDFNFKLAPACDDLKPRMDAPGREVSALAVEKENGSYYVLSGTNDLVPPDLPLGSNIEDILPDMIREVFEQASANKANVFNDKVYVGYYDSPSGSERLFYIQAGKPFTELDRDLIAVLTGNIGIALDNIYLGQEIIETQKEVVLTLGEVVETRLHEAANHVARVAEISYHLAKLWGMGDDEAELLRLASPMHDLGKIGIPDNILLKPGRLTEDEMVVMRTHSSIGHRLLCKSERPILQAASIIALQHHERWDGKGYPDGRAGEDIHIYGRVTAVADVFDALLSRRCYKEPWDRDMVFDLVREERGRQFDPVLVDLLLSNADLFIGIWEAMPDDA